MAERWVINASPVILLAKAEIIGFLPGLCDELVIPAGVVDEVRNVHITDTGRKWLETEGKRSIRKGPAIHDALATWSGGAGEAEVISWALQNPGFTAILDDRRLIPAARPALERLRGVGAYVTDELIDRSIALAGES